MSDAGRILVHYTRDPSTVASILTHGFLLVPNRRDLIQQLLPDEPFEDREPQQFGMASFSELPLFDAAHHRQQFGDFGIAIKWSWANQHNAQRVIYVERTGPLTETFRLLFRLAKQQIDESGISEAEKRWLLNNKVVAGLRGFALYANLLTTYEFMQPERDSCQLEWRIVSGIPNYQDLKSRPEMVADLLALRKAWPKAEGLGAVTIRPEDVEFLVCPWRDRKTLQRALPEPFKKVRIRTYFGRARLDRFAAWLDLRSVPKTPMNAVDNQPVRPKDLVSGIAYVPDLLEVIGAVLYPAAVKEDTFIEANYRGPGPETYSLRIARLATLQLKWFAEELERRLLDSSSP